MPYTGKKSNVHIFLLFKSDAKGNVIDELLIIDRINMDNLELVWTAAKTTLLPAGGCLQ